MLEQRHIGSIAAIICAGTYLFGFAMLVTVLAPAGYGSDDIDAATVLAFASDHFALVAIWNLAIYVVNGLALAFLATALAARFRAHLPGLAQSILAIGLLWATLVTGAGMVANVGLEAALRRYATDPEGAANLWEVLHTVELGLGGGNEIAGGIWAILIGLAALISRRLPRALGWVSLVIGLSGLATLFPILGETPGAVFGLGYILWFGWVALSLARLARTSF